MAGLHVCTAASFCGNADCRHAKPHEHDHTKGCSNTDWCQKLTVVAVEFIKKNAPKTASVANRESVDTMAPWGHRNALRDANELGANIPYPRCEEIGG